MAGAGSGSVPVPDAAQWSPQCISANFDIHAGGRNHHDLCSQVSLINHHHLEVQEVEYGCPTTFSLPFDPGDWANHCPTLAPPRLRATVIAVVPSFALFVALCCHDCMPEETCKIAMAEEQARARHAVSDDSVSG